jgi:hypothetical protein
LISLVDSASGSRVDLVVIPPQTDHMIAQRALTLAGHAGDLHRPVDIIEQANLTAASAMSRNRGDDPLPTAEWETDGGRTRRS